MSKYTTETKRKAVAEVIERHKSARSVAKSIGTAKAVVQRWVALYKNIGDEGL